MKQSDSKKHDVVIVGGGPAGSTSAMYLMKQGVRPLIIEHKSFPRYHIGESMTGECGAIVRDLGLEQEMLQCGHPVKHGVRVFGQSAWWVPVMARDENGNLQDQFTWQVRRSEFDQMMLDEAVARGATVIQGKAVRPLVDEDGTVRGTEVRDPDGNLFEVDSKVLLDCSGQATFLANAGVTGPKYRGNYDKQVAIFSQVRGGIRDHGSARENQNGNTLIFYKEKYHWAWWIPIDDEVISVGVVSPADYFKGKNESKAEFLTRELHELHPELKRRIPEVDLVEEVRAIPNYSYQVRSFCGKGYICIGDAHRFVDPIFSFGLYVSMKEAQLAAPLIKAYLDGANRDVANPFADHQIYCEQGIDVLEDFLDAFWEHTLSFAMVVHARYRENMIDVFAGRVYENQPSPPVIDFRNLLKRERTYDDLDDEYSVPIGSRYHPERAPLWEEDHAAIELLEAS